MPGMRELAAAGVELIATEREAVDRLAAAFERGGGGARPRARRRPIAYRPRSEAADADDARRRARRAPRGRPARAATPGGARTSTRSRSSSTAAPLRRYGSQGQQRLALLALLFAERRALLDDGRPPPLMLLDDVTSELDSERRGLLVEHLRRRRPGADHGHRARPAAGPRRAPRGRDAVRAGAGRRRARPRREPAGTAAAAPRRGDRAPFAAAPSRRPRWPRSRRAWPGRSASGSPTRREPVPEREASVTVACRAATWAQELDLLQDELLERLRAGRSAKAPHRALRFVVGAGAVPGLHFSA